MASLPPALREAIDSQGEFRQPDGSPMQADEVRKAVEQAESQLTPEQQTRLTDLTAELDRRHQELKNLAEMLKQAAQRSTASPLVLEQESTLLNQLAGQAGKMAADLSPPTGWQGKPAMVERELKAEKPAANHRSIWPNSNSQLRQLDAAPGNCGVRPAVGSADARRPGSGVRRGPRAPSWRHWRAIWMRVPRNCKRLRKQTEQTCPASTHGRRQDARQLASANRIGSHGRRRDRSVTRRPWHRRRGRKTAAGSLDAAQRRSRGDALCGL